MILTLRPILLHLTKAILSGDTTFSSSGHAFQQLTCTCIEAARRSLELMGLAQKEDMIGWYSLYISQSRSVLTDNSKVRLFRLGRYLFRGLHHAACCNH